MFYRVHQKKAPQDFRPKNPHASTKLHNPKEFIQLFNGVWIVCFGGNMRILGKKILGCRRVFRGGADTAFCPPPPKKWNK